MSIKVIPVLNSSLLRLRGPSYTLIILIEFSKDPVLLQAVREEVSGAFVMDLVPGERALDLEKMLALPLLQSLLTEILRMRVSIVIMRVVEQPMVVDGVHIPQWPW